MYITVSKVEELSFKISQIQQELFELKMRVKESESNLIKEAPNPTSTITAKDAISVTEWLQKNTQMTPQRALEIFLLLQSFYEDNIGKGLCEIVAMIESGYNLLNESEATEFLANHLVRPNYSDPQVSYWWPIQDSNSRFIYLDEKISKLKEQCYHAEKNR